MSAAAGSTAIRPRPGRSRHADGLHGAGRPAFRPRSRPNSTSCSPTSRIPPRPLYHHWLTPEEFGNRFGLSPADHSKVVAWLTSAGFTVNESGRGRNWIAFSGTAGQVSRALHTPIHRFQVDGETHYANTAEPRCRRPWQT